MLLALVVAFPAAAGRDAPADYSRAPDQPVDQAYTDLIAKFTTDPALNSPLTDYLPASDPVPTPLDVFGRIAGAEGWLRSEEHTSELQSLMRISYAVSCVNTTNNHYYVRTPIHH